MNIEEVIRKKPLTGRNKSFSNTLRELYLKYGNAQLNFVETGTIRNKSDSFRFGDGWATLNWMAWIEFYGGHIWTVDTDPSAVEICKEVTKNNINITYVIEDSVTFLKNFDRKINLLYLDSYDFCGNDENIKKCHSHQLQEVIASFDKLDEKALILSDDNFCTDFNSFPFGKGKESLPFLLNNGFHIIHYEETQFLLSR
jgi:hypothetical protein